jgi:hypothetical protein
MANYAASAKNGLLGEVLTELELIKRDWHVERLDGKSHAINADLIAAKGWKRVIIQVKASLSWDRPSFGHATHFLNGTKKQFFNSVESALMTDFVVTVVGGAENPTFHVFPVRDAERLAQAKATEWFETPTKQGKRRSPKFPVSLGKADPAIKKFEGAWDLMDASDG